MNKGNVTKSSGQIPKILLILIGAIIVVVIIAVVVTNIVRKPTTPSPEEIEEEKKPELVYEVVIGDIKFKLKEAKDIGSVLNASESKYPEWQQKDLTTTEKFIEVTIGAENIGKDNIQQGFWEMNELIDNEGRNFYSSQETEPWIPVESKCSALLKPGFAPTPCTKIYEVAKISTGLKVRVSSRQTGISFGEEKIFIDLGL
ncbi:hypothetical protein AMJ49_02570 [Parcubacteria bacterium DG_74_2]|nr:MAG: hypothetical protein AMJ49_02570 [Parcubacteria bacterium DG_74_2]